MEPLHWLLIFLLVLAVAVIARLNRDHRYDAPGSAKMKAPDDNRDRLGLSEVRTRPSRPEHSKSKVLAGDEKTSIKNSVEGAEAASTSHDAGRRDTGHVDREGAVSAARPVQRTARPFVRSASPLWEGEAPDIGHLLAALATALAGTAALLRFDRTGNRFVVDALSDSGVRLRPDAVIDAGTSLLGEAPQERAPILLEKDVQRDLCYHSAPEKAVSRAAMVALAPPPAPRVFLVVDGPPPRSDFHVDELTQVTAYAGFLAQRLGLEKATGTESTSDTPPQAIDASSSTSDYPSSSDYAGEEPGGVQAEEAPSPRPRAEILAEEMESARAAGHAVAFALVVPHDADALITEGNALVERAEAALRERLHRAPGTTRVEPFGELVLGAFCSLSETSVEEWAQLVGGAGEAVHIGAVMLTEARTDPQGVRAEAEAALHEAYEQGETCVIVE